MTMKKNVRILFLVSMFLLAIISAANAKTIYTDADRPPGGDGLSWSTAFKDLQDGLADAGGGDEIWVAAGTYYPSVEVGGIGSRYQAFQMKNGVAIYGGFVGTETSLAQRATSMCSLLTY